MSDRDALGYAGNDVAPFCLSQSDLQVIGEELARLASSIDALRKVEEGLLRWAEGSSRPPREVLEAVAGGLRDDGSFAPDAYALMVKRLLGIYADVENLVWSEGGVPLSIKRGRTRFREYIELIGDAATRALSMLRSMGVRVETGRVERVESLDAQEAVRLVLEASTRLLPGFNPAATKLWLLRRMLRTHVTMIARGCEGARTLEVISQVGVETLLEYNGASIVGYPDYMDVLEVHVQGRRDGGLRVYVRGLPRLGDGVTGDGVETFGALYAYLVNLIWLMFRSLKGELRNWFNGVDDYEQVFQRRAAEVVDRFTDGITGRLTLYSIHILDLLYDTLDSVWLLAPRDSMTRAVLYDINGVKLEEETIDMPFKLVVEKVMPLVTLGLYDAAFGFNGRRGLVLIRRAGSREWA